MMGICFMSSSLIFYLESSKAKGRLNGYKRVKVSDKNDLLFAAFMLRPSTGVTLLQRATFG